jgi:hypothetical protein
MTSGMKEGFTGWESRSNSTMSDGSTSSGARDTDIR